VNVCAQATCLAAVTAELDPAIHDEAPRIMVFVNFSVRQLIMDCRVKPAHDNGKVMEFDL
jgi:hypothetical protein